MTEEGDIIRQENIIADSVAARDINTDLSTHFHYGGKGTGRLTQLFKNLIKEIEDDKKIDEETVDALQKYICTDNDDVVGLQVKLEKASLDYLLDQAEEAKEDFVKKLAQYQMYESAQNIFAFLLRKSETLFRAYILPKIQAGEAIEIPRLLHEEITLKLEGELAGCPIEVFSDEIEGMIYFLVGKCRLRLHV